MVCQESHVASPVGEPLIGMVSGIADSGSFHTYQPKPEFLCGATSGGRDLSASTRGPVEPQHQRSIRVPELRVAKAPLIAQHEYSLEARRRGLSYPLMSNQRANPSVSVDFANARSNHGDPGGLVQCVARLRPVDGECEDAVV
jgi:hypothetical protein